MGKIKDLTGMRFGSLTVIKFFEINKFHQATWVVKCDCGTEKVAIGSPMISGHAISCGCIGRRAGQKNKLDLSNQRFGKLVALYTDGSKNNAGRYIWTCMCDCGNITRTTSGNLRNGSTKSCGCYAVERTKQSNTTHGLSNTPQYFRVASQKRREMKRKLDFEWTAEMDSEIRLFFKRCVLCGSRDNLAVDHVLPLSKGNGVVPGNAAVLCKSCNSKKNNKNLDEIDSDDAIRLTYAADEFRMYWHIYHGEDF